MSIFLPGYGTVSDARAREIRDLLTAELDKGREQTFGLTAIVSDRAVRTNGRDFNQYQAGAHLKKYIAGEIGVGKDEIQVYVQPIKGGDD